MVGTIKNAVIQISTPTSYDITNSLSGFLMWGMKVIILLNLKEAVLKELTELTWELLE